MAEYSYTVVLGKLKVLLGKIRNIGVPDKVTIKWLESLGYKSKNDRSMLPVLQQIGLTNEEGIPTERWTKYRGASNKKVLAKGIKEGYDDLFATYPDAYARSNEELESFFSTRSTAGKQVISKTAGTFKTLCELADFSSSDDTVSEENNSSAKVFQNQSKENPTFAPKLHIDIQIHISPDTTSQQIEQIFKSMAKHIYRIKE